MSREDYGEEKEIAPETKEKLGKLPKLYDPEHTKQLGHIIPNKLFILCHRASHPKIGGWEEGTFHFLLCKRQKPRGVVIWPSRQSQVEGDSLV